MFGFVLGVILSVVFLAGYMTPLIRGVVRRTPAGVIKRLPTVGSQHTVRLTWMTAYGGTWNPQKPLGLNNAIFSPGHGVYTRDDEDHVQLSWQRRTDSTQIYRGAIPAALRPDSSERRRIRHVVHVLVAVYGCVSVIGFAVGFGVAHGPIGEHLAAGGFGVLAGWLLIWFASMVFSVGRASRDALASPGGTRGSLPPHKP